MHRRRALIFPGQGAQFIGMAADLHAAYPAARRAIDSAQETLNIDLKEFMFNGVCFKSRLTHLHDLCLIRITRTSMSIVYACYAFNDPISLFLTSRRVPFSIFVFYPS